ncbi:MAG: peptidase M48 [Marinilabiliales bacterium]|nr:MAG: peptidase M48 [Marinilabiliales bacterium]
MRKLHLVLFLTALIIGQSCSKVPVTGRKQFRMLPQKLILGMSLTNYQDFLSSNTVVPATDERTKLVRKVGSNLQTAVTNYLHKNGYSKRLKGFSWQYNLVQNSTVNAWCMPGGRIVVYSGLLPITETEAGLATVMSHEIAHAVARHGNERMSQQLALILGGVTLAVALNDHPEETRNIFLAVYGVGGTLGALAYSRKHEYEADKIGMVFMALAGYDPSEAVKFWERMAAHSGPSIPQFLSTHPSDENRVKAMKEFLPTAMQYYKKN